MDDEFSCEYRVVELFVSDVFVPQNARCELWYTCVKGKKSFDEACSEVDYNFDALLAKGFNRNFLTRARWLDIKVLTEKLHVGLFVLKETLKVTTDQIVSWNLTPEELRAFDNVEARKHYYC